MDNKIIIETNIKATGDISYNRIRLHEFRARHF